LITRGPPYNILDDAPIGGHVGCAALKARIARLPQLRLHVFGHIHCGYGVSGLAWKTYVNAAICNEEYKPLNPPIVVDLGEERCRVVAPERLTRLERIQWGGTFV